MIFVSVLNTSHVRAALLCHLLAVTSLPSLPRPRPVGLVCCLPLYIALE